MRSPRRFGFPLLLVIILIAAAACSPGGEAGKSGSKHLTLAVIPMGTTHEFWKAIHAGALTAARELGVEIIWKGPLKEDDRNEQIQIVETLTNAGVDALVLTPMDDRALVRPVAEAKRAGHPDGHLQLGPAGRATTSPTSRPTTTRAGVWRPSASARCSGAAATAILIRVIASVEGSTKREEGFLDTMQDEVPRHHDPLRQPVRRHHHRDGLPDGREPAHPLSRRRRRLHAQRIDDLRLPCGPSRTTAWPARSSTSASIRRRSSSRPWRRTEIQGLVLQDPFHMGYQSVRTAVAHLRGQPYEKTVDTGVFLATPENMNEPAIDAAFCGPTSPSWSDDGLRHWPKGPAT